MLDIKWIRENPDALTRALIDRGADPAAAKEQVADLIVRDEARRAHIVKLEEAQARRNAASKAIGAAKAKKDEAEATRLMAEVADLKTWLQQAEDEGRKLDKNLEEALAVVPNVPADDVPVGPDERANRVEHAWGTRPGLNDPREHFELGAALGGMDFEAAAKLSGSRFVVLSGKLARLERALGQFMLDLHTEEHGYTEVLPPLLVNNQTMFGTGQLPKFEDDQFPSIPADLLSDDSFSERSAAIERTAIRNWFEHYVDRLETKDFFQQVIDSPSSDEAWAILRQHRFKPKPDNLRSFFLETVRNLAQSSRSQAEGQRLWLIPTAEVPLTNLVRESILDEAALPLRYTALTPCFRSEAGAAGKDTRGMLRQHQFDKVELVSITTPEQSAEEHERMLMCAEEVLKRLDLHYRVVTLSTGDMGFAARKTWDIEVWLPGQATYREISSVSLCGDFQARRMQARYRPKEGQEARSGEAATGSQKRGTRLVHTLNGSGVAVGRALIAVMENYQNSDGSVTVPEVVRPYMGGRERIEKDGQ